MKNLFTSLSFLVFLVVSSNLFADEQYTHFGVALRGYDAVAYHTENKAIEGDSNQSVHHNGLTYLFSSEKNADMFRKNPSKYEPAYNGYCAYGLANGKKFPSDPQAFKVVNGKLYMNLNKNVQNLWLKDSDGYIATANKLWPDIKDKHPNEL